MRVTLAALCVTAIVLTGCSSKPEPKTGPVEAAFIAAANNACEPFLDQGANKPFPYPSFDATNPLVTQLPAAGKYYDGLPINHQELNLVTAMGKPKRGRDTWNTFVSLVGQEQDVVSKQIKAAEASDKAGFVATVSQVAALAKQIDTAAAAVGFAKDASCTQLFG